jgi:hypothetical protein
LKTRVCLLFLSGWTFGRDLDPRPLPHQEPKLFFTSQIFQEALIIHVFFPDVIGTLAPTVTVALVNTVSTLRIVERFTFTHKELANYLIYTINISVFPKQQRIVTNSLSGPDGFYLIGG